MFSTETRREGHFFHWVIRCRFWLRKGKENAMVRVGARLRLRLRLRVRVRVRESV
jgi:hypothetical protein